MNKGMLVVIEGACDGIGKTTQFNMLIDKLKKDGIKIYTHHFPSYGTVQGARVVKFLKDAETYYLATVEGDQPRVRPFGTAHIFEGKLYIQTGKVKDVSKQIHANPKVEICAFKNGEWLRVAGELVEDDRREARQSMLDAYPSLQKMYSADDGNTEVFYFKNATATFSSFTHAPEVVKF